MRNIGEDKMTDEEITKIEEFLSEIQFTPNTDQVARLIRIAESLLNLAKEKNKRRN
jgi:hypothetical protein